MNNNESIEPHLLTIYGMVNDALKFAEGKNAALVTFNGAAIYVTAMSKNVLPDNLTMLLPYLHTLLVMSIGLCLLAFLPVVAPPQKPSDKDIRLRESLGNRANVFFFGHLRLFDPEQLVRYLHRTYGQPVPSVLALNEIFLSAELILQSRITWRKHFLFALAGQLTLFALLVPVPVLAVYWAVRIVNRRRRARERAAMRTAQ